jgi:hypothetical protein
LKEKKEKTSTYKKTILKMNYEIKKKKILSNFEHQAMTEEKEKKDLIKSISQVFQFSYQSFSVVLIKNLTNLHF